METIANHIGTLIRRHDYVIVPGLGGFMVQKQPAQIKDDIITPPKSAISFNHLMSISDGLLAIEISRADQISFREAVARIETYTHAVLNQLEDGEQVDMAYLGQLYRGEGDKIIFTPNENSVQLPDNFGLTALHYIPRSLQVLEEESERKTILITLPSAKSVMKYAAAAVLAVGLFFTAPKIGDAYNNFGGFTAVSHWFNANTSVALVQEEPVELVVPEVVEEIVVPVVEIPEVIKNHHVIVSAMATEQEADRFCNRLVDLGFEGAHVLEPIRTYRIAISSFETKTEALAFMNELRRTNSAFPDAWVLSQ